MNWKCPSCGSEDNLPGEMRCICGNEVSEEEVQHLQFEKILKEPKRRSSLKNAFIVVIISIVVSAAALPFASLIPHSLKQFISHEASAIGYFIILKDEMKDHPIDIWRVVIWVWLLMASIYTIVFMHQIGTKYTIKGLVVGGLKGEILAAAIALALFGLIRKLRTTK